MINSKNQDREYIERLIQDMKVKLRDIEDFQEGKKYKQIIKQFELGLQKEFY